MEDTIKQIFFSLGADVCGIANIDRFISAPQGFLPTDVFEKCKAVIVFGKALPKGLTHVSSRLVYGYYNYFSCSEVDRIALQAANKIEYLFNARAVPMPCDAPYEFWDKETLTGKGLISMKHAAVLAGLGELGKNSLLINPQFGNLLTIGAVLVDIDLKSDEMCQGICIANCTKCIESCRVHAIENGCINQALCRTNTYSKTQRGFDTVECNACRVVCPMRYGRGK